MDISNYQKLFILFYLFVFYGEEQKLFKMSEGRNVAKKLGSYWIR